MHTLRSKPNKPAVIAALGAATLLALVIALGTPAVAPAQPAAQIVAFSYQGGGATITLGVAVPKGIDNAARTGNADWGLRLTVTFVDVNGAVQILDPGRLSIKNNTILRAPIDNNTVLIEATLNFAATPLPNANTPNFTGTAQLLHP